MSNEQSIKDSDNKSWFERLSYALLREPQDREQLVDLLRDAEQRELLDSDALAMIEGVLQVSEMKVRDIMIPRTQMTSIDEDQDIHQFLPTVIESGHSRFPVLSDNQNKVVGIIHAKDLLKYSDDSVEFSMRDILRPAVIVPESKRLDVLLKEFRANRNHMAIVIDEYGSLSGFVTIEDILEQIVGDIEDEFDIDADALIKKHSDSEFIVNAQTPIDEFNDYFHSEFSDEEFDTIGGLVIQSLGHLPKRGEKTIIQHYTFEILHANKRRIRLLKMTLEKQQSEQAA